MIVPKIDVGLQTFSHANNESSEVFDWSKPRRVKIKDHSIMSRTSDDSLFAAPACTAASALPPTTE